MYKHFTLFFIVSKGPTQALKIQVVLEFLNIIINYGRSECFHTKYLRN